VAPIAVEESMENVVEEKDHMCPKGNKVPLMEKVLKERIWFSLMLSPFWFSTLESKKAMLILMQGKH